MKQTTTIIILFIISVFSFQQLKAQAPVNYYDVGVIVNSKSAFSVAIGNYFMAQRHIPKSNLIVFSGDTSEETDSANFEAIRAQIEDTIVARGLIYKLNYLVTTRGVPLKITRGDQCVLTYTENDSSGINPFILNRVRCSSFDAELMLILGKDSVYIGGGNIVTKSYNILTQPYLDTSYTEPSSHFSKAKYGIYLVSRLDAYSFDEVHRMIDSSGPNTLVNKDSALFVIDAEDTLFGAAINEATEPSYYALDLYEKRADSILVKRGWKVLYDTTTAFLTGQRNVLGYISWGSDAKHGSAKKGNIKPMDKWYKASYAEIFTSYTARSFAYPPSYPSSDGGSLISDLINEGATGTSGPVWEPYTWGFSDVSILFDRYTDTTQAVRYNLAESYYMANPTMGWMMTLVGDPKTSIVTHLPPIPKPAITKINQVCQGTTYILTSSNNLTGNYNWFNGDSNSIKATGQNYDSTNSLWAGSGTSFNIPVTNVGTYTYTYVNENIAGAGLAEVTISVIAAPSASFTLTATGCSTTLKADSAAGYTYQWNLNGSPITGATSLYYSVPTPGAYTVTVKNSNGCSATSASQNASPGSGSISATIKASGPNTFCQGDSVVLTASSGAGYIYQWLRNDTAIADTSMVLTVKKSGNYSIKISNKSGCSNTSIATKVTVNQATPTPTITKSGDTLISSSTSGNEWYLNGNFIIGGTSQKLILSKGGIYTVKVTGGCNTATSSGYGYLGIAGIQRNAFNLNIYPNPSNGSFTINATFANAQQTIINIKDVLGRSIFSKNYGSVSSVNDQLTISNPVEGIYFLSVMNGNETVVKKIIVK